MSQQLIGRSPDLKRLRDEGFDIEVKTGFLLVKDVPYVNASKEIKRGILVSVLTLAGDKTAKPDNHVVYFAGEYPCHVDGTPIEGFRNQSERRQLADEVIINHTFSAKPMLPQTAYEDYYHKMTTYVANISRHAQSLAPEVTAKSFNPIVDKDESSVFNYFDSATSRAEIDLAARKLALSNVAIIGLGGSGSYVLDLVAKTPVQEIHLFDGDSFFQHNAFRSPGAPSLSELAARPNKALYFKNIYSKMHRNITPHEVFVDEKNVDQLCKMNFVFLCIDRGNAKKMIIQKLEESNVQFIDVGMGIYMQDSSIGGILRVTTSTPQKRNHIRARIDLSDEDVGDEYVSNIQIADLNALNAALAVIKWKKLYGFYMDFDHEYNSTYTINGNMLLNEDKYES